jgi:adenylate cyclase
MAAKLKVEMGGQPPRELEIGSLLAIGRASGSGVVVKDNKVSRNHAVIQQHGSGTHYLLDLGSANGTFVNGRRVTTPVALKTGDIINVGGATMEYFGDATAVAAPSTSDIQTIVDFQATKVTILVCDVRNFTSMSEKMPPKDISLLIGSWFKEVTTLIDQHQGMVDKFIGDCVMAYWIKAQTAGNIDYVLQPLKAALALVDLAEVFAGRFADLLPGKEFKVGIGLHTGETVIGNVGTSGRDITAMGDTVNVAFRLESLTKAMGRTILVGGQVAQIAAGAFEFEDMGAVELKGKNEKVQAFALKGLAPAGPLSTSVDKPQ